MGTPPDALLRLVDRFSQDRKVFLSPDYKEEQFHAIRRSAFGVRTSLGPVIHEESINARPERSRRVAE